MKHTPGPWRFNAGTMDVENSVGHTVAFPRGGGAAPGQYENQVYANAYLIAAAPALLETLETLVAEMYHGNSDKNDTCYEPDICPKCMVLALCRKARGGK